jgi:hypothetical protein
MTNSLKAQVAGGGMTQRAAGEAWTKMAGMYGNTGYRVGAGIAGAYGAYASQKNFRQGRYGRGTLWGAFAAGQGMYAWRGGNIAQKMASGLVF